MADVYIVCVNFEMREHSYLIISVIFGCARIHIGRSSSSSALSTPPSTAHRDRLEPNQPQKLHHQQQQQQQQHLQQHPYQHSAKFIDRCSGSCFGIAHLFSAPPVLLLLLQQLLLPPLLLMQPLLHLPGRWNGSSGGSSSSSHQPSVAAGQPPSIHHWYMLYDHLPIKRLQFAGVAITRPATGLLLPRACLSSAILLPISDCMYATDCITASSTVEKDSGACKLADKVSKCLYLSPGVAIRSRPPGPLSRPNRRLIKIPLDYIVRSYPVYAVDARTGSRQRS